MIMGMKSYFREGKNVLLLCIGILLMTCLFDYAYVSEHIDHKCAGEGCEICSNLDTFLNGELKKGLPILLPVLILAKRVFELIRSIADDRKSTDLRFHRSLNVRMNN